MSLDDVVRVLDRLERAGVEVWLDGGWGIDALLGEQTRAHSDLDVVVRSDDLDLARRTLAVEDFAPARQERPGLPARLVMRDPDGRQVDFHPVEFDGEGNGLQDLGHGRVGLYPAQGLEGRGKLGARAVRCITPDLQVAHHSGYELADHERRDLALLAERFGLD